MPILNNEKRPKGLRALSAFRSKSNKKNLDPPSSPDEPVDVPDYMMGENIPPIPTDKQLPTPPPPMSFPLPPHPSENSGFARPPRPVNGYGGPAPAPMPMPVPAAVPAVPSPAPEPLQTLPVNSVPTFGVEPSVNPTSPAAAAVSPIETPKPAHYYPAPPQTAVPVSATDTAGPISPPMAQARRPRDNIHTAPTLPHAPQPIRPSSSIPVVERLPSRESDPDDPDPDLRASATGTITPVAVVNGTTNDNIDLSSDEAAEAEDRQPPPITPDTERIAAPLNEIHFACYQDHRSMPIANNIWHPLSCMACKRFDQEIRHRCVFCCLRICNSCYQILQRCPKRSLGRLMELVVPAEE